jgi:hypothetical protein
MRRTTLAFVLALLAFLLGNNWIHLTYFAPLLIILYYDRDKITALWFSVVCGIILDSLSSQTQFGIFTLNYCLTTLLIYELKPFFFADAITTIPFLTTIFAVTSTILQYILLQIFNISFPITWQWIAIDVIIMPIIDGIYGLVFFALPFMFIKHEKISRSKYIFNKRTRPTLHKHNQAH